MTGHTQTSGNGNPNNPAEVSDDDEQEDEQAPVWQGGHWDPPHTSADDENAHSPLGWNVNFDTATDAQVLALATNPMKLELPKVEPAKPTCEGACDAYNKRQEEGCDHVRKRAALWLKQHGCPSIVKGYKKKNKSKCGAPKKRVPVRASPSNGCSTGACSLPRKKRGAAAITCGLDDITAMETDL